jgi:hypothetical protein
MSCGGNMMRAPFQPLAHLVDAAALKWLAAKQASIQEQNSVSAEIARSFGTGEKPELTYHGIKYLLTIYYSKGPPEQFQINVHKKVFDN